MIDVCHDQAVNTHESSDLMTPGLGIASRSSLTFHYPGHLMEWTQGPAFGAANMS